MLRHAHLEGAISLIFEHAERGQVGRRPIALVEARQIEALVLAESLIGDHLRIYVRPVFNFHIS